MKDELSLEASLGIVVYFFVAGAIFLSAPWSNLWPDTPFSLPWLSVVLTNPLIKGAFSGYGLVLLVAAIIEIRHVISKKN